MPDELLHDGPAPYDQDFADLEPEEAIEPGESAEEETADEKEESEEEATEDSEESQEETEEEPVRIPFDRPTVKEMNAEYPGIFKKFPGLKEAFFREAQFTQVFPTIEDAKEAFNDNEAFNVLSDSALSGDPAPLLDSMERTDKKALELFSAGFLPALYKKSPEVYTTVVNPLFQNLVRQFYKSAKDDNVKNAALHLSDFLFGDDGEDIVSGKKSVSSVDLVKEGEKLRTAKAAEDSTKYIGFYKSVEPSIEKSMESLIVKQLDPQKELFSPFLRRTGAKEIAKKISDQLQSDEGHKKVMQAWWKRAKSAGYSDDYKDKIVSTYLARAKSLIPRITAEVSAEMLGTKKKAASNLRERTEPAAKQNNSGRDSRNGHTKVDYSKMSDMDILSS